MARISKFSKIALMLIIRVQGISSNHQCKYLNEVCNPQHRNPCCDENSKCTWLSSANEYHCIAKAKLGDLCRNSADCSDIRHSKCSPEGLCTCRQNNIQMNSTNCMPLLNEFCWKEQCGPKNSICDGNECKCKRGFIPTSNNFCSRMLLGSSCDSDETCRPIKFSECSSGVCVCSKKTIAMNSISCSLLLRDFCLSDTDCKIAHSNCIDNQCQCKSHYISHSNIECKLSYMDMPCRSTWDCKGDLRPLECIDNTCQCTRHPSLLDRNTCLVPMRQKCLENFDCPTENFLCIANSCQCRSNYLFSGSECLPRFLEGHCYAHEDCSNIKYAICFDNKCICDDKFVALNQTMCTKALGSDCSSNEDCLLKNSYCHQSHCECRDGYAQNFQGKCLTMDLQEFCSTDNDCILIRNSQCSENNQCICKENHVKTHDMLCAPLLGETCSNIIQCAVENSVCKDDKCQCSDNYLQLSNNKCVPKYSGKKCVNDVDCSEISRAQCSNTGQCVCDPNFVQLEPQICAPLLGGHCSNDSDCVTDHSTCFESQCRCSRNFSQHSQDLCVPVYLGQICNDNDDCNEILNGKCSEDNICICKPNHSKFDPLVCLPLIGGYCKEHKDCFVHNSNCLNNTCLCLENYVAQSNSQCLSRYIDHICYSDSDCYDVLNSHCTRFNKCACNIHFVAIEGICHPMFGQCRSKKVTCAIPNSQCIDDQCQCNPNFVKGLYNDCLPTRIGEFCTNDDVCTKITYSKCVKNECQCRNNYIGISNEACGPLLHGFCQNNCIVENSVCVRNKCQCSYAHKEQVPNLCVPISLGDPCHTDDNCKMIQRATCSSDKICACSLGTYFVDSMTCAPLLNSSCSLNDCRVESSHCIDQRCQCRPGYSAVSASQCVKTSTLYSCWDDSHCVEPWHFDCSEKKKCVCKENNLAITNSTCLPTLKGACWKDDQCITENSSCIHFHCHCSSGFLSVSGNKCVLKVF